MPRHRIRPLGPEPAIATDLGRDAPRRPQREPSPQGEAQSTRSARRGRGTAPTPRRRPGSARCRGRRTGRWSTPGTWPTGQRDRPRLRADPFPGCVTRVVQRTGEPHDQDGAPTGDTRHDHDLVVHIHDRYSAAVSVLRAAECYRRPACRKHAAVIEDVDVGGPGYTLPSTISLPARDGPVPCVVFFAGSGPTDRDWTSPLLPGTNGSGAQLALALQARGVGSIRFDKVGSGVNMPKSAAPADLKMLDVLSLAHYVDEAETAFDELATSGWMRQDLPARPQRRIDPRVVGGHREAGGSTLRRLHQPVRAVAFDPRHGDRADPGDPHQGWQRRRGRGQGARGLSRGDAGARRTGARSVGAPRGRGPVASDALAGATEGRARIDLRGPARGAARLSRSRPRGLGRQRRPGARVRCGQDLRGPGERPRRTRCG